MTEKLKGIAGSMCAGKTRMLIFIVERAEFKKQSDLAFKPSANNMWNSENLFISRETNNNKPRTYSTRSVDSAIKILEILEL